MAAEKITMDANVFESKLGGITVRGQAHSLSAWFVLALRLMMGYAFLYAGLDKLLAAEAFSAEGFLLHGVNEASPLIGMFTWMGTTSWFVEIVNIAVPFGQIAIGLGLLVGAFVRLAAFFGATMMFMFYFANWSVEHGMINGDFAYLLVFLAVAAFGAGRILGLDQLIERYEIDGQPLIEKYPTLDYILG
ncbi:DoxX family protein [Halobacteria archaeon AArc-m2/3/4]|uniref:DoxX family protein n=1 Tax=Natronoglomus mannanivorans TaxID=2979990 RepID=A0AAP2Z381_9EURY|nr:DoxX family protein [Halobacteria archaeon AArc-xg1-1]MCU4974641.1 DoxX family protein [Halobacteria archaeon AArc-m2/3/4]